jgi:hypothetical protein
LAGGILIFTGSKTGSYTEASIGVPWEEDDYEVTDSETIKLSAIFKRKGQKYVYTYDFGDSWEHHILLERTEKEVEGAARSIGGEGACPPEDCGGPWGYSDLKETMNNNKHPDYKDMKTWLGLKRGETWDAFAFALKEADEKVRKV